MKKLLKYIMIILILFPLSCSEDYLNKFPLDRLSAGTFDPDLSLTGIYASLQNVYVSQYAHAIDGLTPIVYCRNSGWRSIATGAANEFTSRFYSSWQQFYSGIFRANDFLERLSALEDIDATKKTVFEAEARFLRAYYYHRLVTVFGGVPLVLGTLEIDESREQVRASKDAVIAQIMADLDFAESNLAVAPRKVGAATKGAAIALKARTHLYEGNWQGTKDAASSVMGLGYDLYKGAANDSLNYSMIFDFKNENNIEVIFDVQFDAPNVNEGNTFETWLMNKNSAIDFGYVQSHPTKYLVEQYEHRDGTMPIDPYDFSNRDYRFYYTVLFEGSSFNDKVYNSSFPGWALSKTRFVQRKYTVEHSEGIITQRFDAPNNFILIRYADILLMYAEAQNELSGPDASVSEAVNQVRNRAGLPDLPAGLSKDEMREAIHHERLVELALEGLYYFDMLRWGKAGTLTGGVGADVYMANNPPTRYPDDKKVDTWLFDPAKNYLWPIPQTEIDNVLTLEQNPGW
ncbi:MAG: RagB/SusD family nutrient uptake outer membrane protein [Prolixibacteraceae bacterium]|jgi:starch-binding outer membrane protein, SusD/RagB family|nr:RagB/SusD family nutrient uptake outer membrane protein [Prolixibacteraceae bacterium]MBT6762914.1 RagB/SusD family nutrient uptake outer membrane protein [Prolixibacteraceae bacterium]MBT7396654.1 RagB/SusD family nutrient uptake outer membrane protein [Prolixibacteraceae bacterium]